MNKLSELHSIVEAILFLENSFISAKDLSNKASCKEEKIENIVNEINAMYTTHGHAFLILKEQNNYLMVITQQFAKTLAHIYKGKQQQKLSRALIESLAVIAYSQPITKSEIDELRGVNSDGVLKVLLGQNLIKVLGRKPVPGSPNQYGTTGEFLRAFGLKSIKDLPKMKSKDIQKFAVPSNEVTTEDSTQNE